MFVMASLVYAQNITREDAMNAIELAEQDINEMQEDGFFMGYVNDTLIQAKQALERADFAETIRQNATGELAEQAKAALEGLNYEGFRYDVVLDYTQQISLRKKQAYELSDSFRALEMQVESYAEKIKAQKDEPGNIITGFFIAIGGEEELVNISETEEILEEARKAFEKERYTEANEKLLEAQKDLEEKKKELATLNVMVRSGKSFIAKNWFGLLVMFLILGALAWFITGKVRVKRVRNKLKDLEAEKKALTRLIKNAQIEKYKKGTMSDTAYRIRMEQYTNRLNQNKQRIPVLKNMLGKK